MPLKKAIICGNYGTGNLGDETILRALVQKFKPQYDLIIMSANPRETEKKFGISSINRLPSGFRSHLKARLCPIGRQEFKKTKAALDACDKFILGGGTLLTDEPKASMLVWGSQVKGALKRGRELEIYANGIGPLHSKWSEKWAASILEKATKISVRDQLSLDWVRKLTNQEPELVSDPVLDLKISTQKQGGHSFPAETIILAPRFWKSYSKNTENVLKKFVQYLCIERGKYMVGIPFDKDSKKDLEMMNKIFDQDGVRERSKIYQDYENEEEVMSAIQNAEALIGMRLHSLIFAHLAETPFVGIAYMEKVSGLGQELNKQEAIVPLETLTFENLQQTYDSFSSNDS